MHYIISHDNSSSLDLDLDFDLDLDLDFDLDLDLDLDLDTCAWGETLDGSRQRATVSVDNWLIIG